VTWRVHDTLMLMRLLLSSVSIGALRCIRLRMRSVLHPYASIAVLTSCDCLPPAAKRQCAGAQGTCQQLEKSYFRLTSAPDPSVVRPPTVLRRALDRLLRLLRDGAVQYFYAVDQFKGMRQVLLRASLRALGALVAPKLSSSGVMIRWCKF